MITHSPWLVRLLAVPCRLTFYVARAIIAAFGADTAAATILSALIVTVAVLLPLLVRVVVVTERWISRRLNMHREREEQRAFEDIVSHLGDVFGNDNPPRQLPPAPPPLRPAVRRRRMHGVRIPGRPRSRRHTTTSSSSDRRLS